MMKKLISVCTPCYNEEGNIELVYQKVKEVMSKFPNYNYEHLFIDNSSQDNTVSILKNIASHDKNVKIIVNTRNFGHIRSPYHLICQATGDAVIFIVSDLQDPPELIEQFIKKWEEGFNIVLGIKEGTKESLLMTFLRRLFYKIVTKFAEVELIEHFTGFGLYDKIIIQLLRDIKDPYPYFRGLICEIGYEKALIGYNQPPRKRGITKNNFYTLYDMAILGITTHSKVPLRMITMSGFLLSLLSILIALIYFIYKIIFWYDFTVGLAPLVIGFFFFVSIQLFFLGLLGEYVGFIHTHILNRPRVIEKERINFDETTD